jgi:spore coat protein U-like protein
MAFGTAQILAANVDATATVSPTCTNTTPYTVSLDLGSNPNPVGRRRMSGPGGANITYWLYRDAARTQVWGATVGTDTVAGTGNGSAQAITVYGRVPAQSSPAPGSYSDVVTATVIY